jgi:hypothetical protein
VKKAKAAGEEKKMALKAKQLEDQAKLLTEQAMQLK